MASTGKWIDGLHADSAVEDAAQRSLEVRLATVAHCLPLAAHLAEHDIEHVHRLRVATRRAAAARKLFREWLPQNEARWVKKQLRRIRRAAGEARDLDVLIARLRREDGAQLSLAIGFLAKRRFALQPELVALADRMRHEDRFIRKTAQLVSKIEAPHAGGESSPPGCFAEWAPPQLARFTTAFVDQLPNDGVDDVDVLHQFRIRAKALRYAIELLSPAFGLELRAEVYPAVEDLQEHLGKITDHVAALRMLGECQSHETDETSRALVGRLLFQEQQQQVEDLHRFHQWWTPKRSEWLKRCLEAEAGPIYDQDAQRIQSPASGGLH